MSKRIRDSKQPRKTSQFKDIVPTPGHPLWKLVTRCFTFVFLLSFGWCLLLTTAVGSVNLGFYPWVLVSVITALCAYCVITALVTKRLAVLAATCLGASWGTLSLLAVLFSLEHLKPTLYQPLWFGLAPPLLLALSYPLWALARRPK